VWTTYRPRKGKRFFCEDCRQEFQRQKREAQGDYVETRDGTEEEAQNGSDDLFESSLTGVIKRLIPAKSFGFITTEAGKDYFFHLTDLVGLEFEDLVEGIKVDFEVKKQPSGGKAGAAQNVQLHIP
jgi:CspA family cold shock protein